MEHNTCTGCIHLIELHKHPSNSSIFQGSIYDKTGLYGCLVLGKMNNSNYATLFDHKPGGCEMYNNGRNEKPFKSDPERLKKILDQYPSIDEQVEFITDLEDIKELKHYYVRDKNFAEAAMIRDHEKKLIEQEEIEKNEKN